MQRTLAPEIATVENLEEIEFAAPGSPAGAFRVGAVLGGEWDLSVVQPDGRHVAVEGCFAGRGHGEFEEE